MPVETRSGGVTITGDRHYVKITERNLSLSNASADYPHALLWERSRTTVEKEYSSAMTNVIDELNWRFEKVQSET